MDDQTQSDELTLEQSFFEGSEQETETPEAETPAAEPNDAAETGAPAEETGAEVDHESEAETETDTEAEAEAEEVFTVKVDGEEFDVPVSELVQGYQREQDYRRKTQALADDRRSFDTDREAAIAQLQHALAYHALPTANAPKMEDFADKPEEFMQAYASWQDQSNRQSQAQQLLEAITAEETQRVMEREAQLLFEKVPEWKDEAARASDYQNMMTVAADRYGFSEQELASVNDHRLILLLRDAARAAEISAKPVVLKRKTEVKPKLNAGAKVKSDPNAAKQKAALGNLSKTGEMSDDDAATLLLN